ncbi:MAG: hypothetical protein ACI9DC_004108 [Gammaproteobacteria bacterium]|jgi:hypothetical protein
MNQPKPGFKRVTHWLSTGYELDIHPIPQHIELLDTLDYIP